jgi:hypothetical protein
MIAWGKSLPQWSLRGNIAGTWIDNDALVFKVISILNTTLSFTMDYRPLTLNRLNQHEYQNH